MWVSNARKAKNALIVYNCYQRIYYNAIDKLQRNNSDLGASCWIRARWNNVIHKNCSGQEVTTPCCAVTLLCTAGKLLVVQWHNSIQQVSFLLCSGINLYNSKVPQDFDMPIVKLYVIAIGILPSCTCFFKIFTRWFLAILSYNILYVSIYMLVKVC